AEAERLASALAEAGRGLVPRPCGGSPLPAATASATAPVRPVAPGPLPAEGELPGEAAATAAFREAMAMGAATGAGSTRGDASGPVPMPAPDAERAAAALGESPRGASGNRQQVIRLGGSEWHARMGRSLRAGLTAGLAGCMLGGAAIAGTAGVLPAPFGAGQDEPGPVRSVSASASGNPNSSEPSLTWESGGPSPSPSGEDGSERPRGGSPTPEGDAHASGRYGIPKGDWGSMFGHRGGYSPRNAVAMCRAYEEGRLDPATKRQWEQAAGGAREANRYCDRVLDDDRRGSAGYGGGYGGDRDGRDDGDGGYGYGDGHYDGYGGYGGSGGSGSGGGYGDGDGGSDGDNDGGMKADGGRYPYGDRSGAQGAGPKGPGAKAPKASQGSENAGGSKNAQGSQGSKGPQKAQGSKNSKPSQAGKPSQGAGPQQGGSDRSRPQGRSGQRSPGFEQR
ncbi:hypothetical protein, partial [Streptomyces pathocidini]